MMLESAHSCKAAFTRADFMATMAVVLLCLFIALPSAADARGQTRSTLCLSNLRHLVFAWQLYATDHDGVLVGNYHTDEARPANPAFDSRKNPWASGWLDWTTGTPDNTNALYLHQQRFARLADYILTPKNVHKCPADTFRSPAQVRNYHHRVRSVAMNSTLGEGNATTLLWDPLYRQARTMAEIYLPSPAETTVIFDEHPDSINDPFLVAPTRARWIDVPGNLHQGAGSFSFADGHVNLHTWHSASLRTLRVRYNFTAPTAGRDDPDITWMSYSSQRSAEQTF